MLQGGDRTRQVLEAIEDTHELQESASDDSADDVYPEGSRLGGAQEDRLPVPDLHTSPPPIQDLMKTKTSVQQDDTVQECLPFLAGLEGCGKSLFDYNKHGIPRLDRDKHIQYLHDSFQKLPSKFVAYDASRPWLLYWALTGLSILGESVEHYRERWYT